MTAPHDELVDRIPGLFAGRLGVRHHQHGDVVVDLRGARLHAAHVEELLDLGIDHPWVGRASHLRVESPGNLQVGHQADHRALRIRERVDQFREVVLEEGLLARIQERDDFLVVDAVGTGDAHVDRLGRAAHVDRLESELPGAIFVLGERQRVDHGQAELAVRALHEFVEDFPDPAGIRPQIGYLGRRAIRVEEIQVDRFGDAVEDVVRAVGQRVQAIFRQIDSDPPEQNVVQCGRQNEHDRDDDQPDPADQQLGGRGSRLAHVSPPSSCPARRRWRITMRR